MQSNLCWQETDEQLPGDGPREQEGMLEGLQKSMRKHLEMINMVITLAVVMIS